jgi:hypothetical protein
VHQTAFDNIRTAIAQEVVLSYRDYSQGSEIYTDVLSSITQNNRPLVFFSRKLSTVQQKYSVTELELLAIVETLKSSKACYGVKLSQFTQHHRNIMQDAIWLTSD